MTTQTNSTLTFNQPNIKNDFSNSNSFLSSHRYHLSEILATIVNEYTEWERPIQHPVSIRDETLEALSDAQYVGPVTQTVDLHASARRNNSYFYVFEYQSKYSFYQQVINFNRQIYDFKYFY